MPSFVKSRTGERRELLREANRARNRREDRRAIALYRRLLLEDPHQVEVALRAAPLLASEGEGFEAWQLFRMAATELGRARRHDAALAVLHDACRFVPHEYDAWRMCAELEIRIGRVQAAYDTLLEGAHVFDRPHTSAQAIRLLTRARSLEEGDPAVALDLARLYARTGLSEDALSLLALFVPNVSGRTLRRVRGLQWRITLSFYHAWGWLRALAQELRGDDTPPPPVRPRMPAAPARDGAHEGSALPDVACEPELPA